MVFEGCHILGLVDIAAHVRTIMLAELLFANRIVVAATHLTLRPFLSLLLGKLLLAQSRVCVLVVVLVKACLGEVSVVVLVTSIVTESSLGS